jgi:RNA 2',3'-cyclic 3'-phosphodiesterase
VRTFVAIPLSDQCREMLRRVQQNLRASEADMRWVAISSIHLTLKFLGEIDPAVVPSLFEAFCEISKSGHALRLRIHGLGSFPNQTNPRVVWCAISGDTDELSKLQKEVENVCAKFGFPVEQRPFSPHLTLGRVKGKRKLQALLDCIKIGSDLECELVADHFNIYRSTLKPQGAVYTILDTIPIGAAH